MAIDHEQGRGQLLALDVDVDQEDAIVEITQQRVELRRKALGLPGPVFQAGCAGQDQAVLKVLVKP